MRDIRKKVVHEVVKASINCMDEQLKVIKPYIISQKIQFYDVKAERHWESIIRCRITQRMAIFHNILNLEPKKEK